MIFFINTNPKSAERNAEILEIIKPTMLMSTKAVEKSQKISWCTRLARIIGILIKKLKSRTVWRSIPATRPNDSVVPLRLSPGKIASA